MHLSFGSPADQSTRAENTWGKHRAAACMLQNSAQCTSENHEKQSSLLTETYKLIFGLTDYIVPKYNYVGLEVETPFLALTDLKYTDDFTLN